MMVRPQLIEVTLNIKEYCKIASILFPQLGMDFRLSHHLFGILGILVSCYDLSWHILEYWIRLLLKNKKEAKQPRKLGLMKPKGIGFLIELEPVNGQADEL